MTGEPDPSWPSDAARAVGHEMAGYAQTVWRIARAPARFAADWSDGKLAALNPLAFMLNALAVLGPWRALCGRLLDPNPVSPPIWFELLKPVWPVVANCVITALAHALMRPLGARRPLRSSVAMSLYVSGGPLAVVQFLTSPVSLYGYLHRFEPLGMAATMSNFALLAVFFAYLIVLEAALHRLPRWRAAVAIFAAWAAWGALSGWMSIHHPDVIRVILE
jgi:hypothetical protein